MNKLISGLLLTIFPALALAADGSLSFTPPASDYSVIFLGNIFGIVDGVLHGSGSQIMGTMFGVFNAAVLALGGIIIMYTLMVSTLNTAQEGQFLGQKWSSIWVPVRTTFGLALLIPKASGYCLMQIFVMWLVVQGVGAADKIWAAALNYLNQGGAIIMAQENPAKTIMKTGKPGVAEGAQTILASQVCMLGLEAQLKSQREIYLRQKQNESGPCYGDEISSDMKDFCNRAVPSFINTVNAVSEQNNAKDAATHMIKMPNFDSYSPYAELNGVCGELHWNKFDITTQESGKAGAIKGVDYDTANMSRAIAVQQMYMDLATVARAMVNNNPELTPRTADVLKDNYSPVARQQFGVPKNLDGKVCQKDDKTCPLWGTAPGSSSAPLFNGSEFRGALTDYNAIMRPALVLQKQSLDRETAEKNRAFIREANESGWIMAGSYFYRLINLSQAAADAATDAFDTNTGLDKSTFSVETFSSAFSERQTGCNTTDSYHILCTWLDQKKSSIEPIQQLIQGGGSIPETRAQELNSTSVSVVDDKGSSTVYGYTANSTLMVTQAQPGIQAPDFTEVKMSQDKIKFKPPSGCDGPISGPFGIFLCIVMVLGIVLMAVMNIVMAALYAAVILLLPSFIEYAMQTAIVGMSVIFETGVKTLNENPNVHPILALAKMGTFYINFAGELWMKMLELTIRIGLIPVVGMVIMPVIAMCLPVIIAWSGVMLGVGFITAYYVPLLPFLIFTFASIGWLIAVIEAMVAAPIVALGITHPEGHEAFGKGETAIMILMNVFLRPSMMIIGYISAIALSVVGVWILNAGFIRSTEFLKAIGGSADSVSTIIGSIPGGYTSWAGVFALFFTILIYTSTYLVIVQKSFTLITYLPDKVLRWIGAQGESIGQEAAQWGEETKGKVEKAGEETSRAQGASAKMAEGYAQKGIEQTKQFAEGGGQSAVKGIGGE